MKTTIQFIIITAVLGLFTQSCRKYNGWGIKGEGESITQTKSIGNFSEIDCEVDAEIIYTQSNDTYIEITAQQNILSVLDMRIEGNTLTIEFKREVWNYKRIKIILHSPTLNAIEIDRSGELIVQNKLSGEDLDIDMSGSGKITIPNIQLNYLKSKISGSGSIKISEGAINNQSISISGSGYYSSEKAISQTCDVNISGSGEAILNAQNKLIVSISGSGKVKYRGKPLVTKDISGSGQLIALD